jgi:hypothetical protein
MSRGCCYGLVLGLAVLSGCARPATSISGSKPIDSYVMLGGDIKTCWFDPDHPLLPNYVYQANVSPDGSKVQITIHNREALGRPGYLAYMIDFNSDNGQTKIEPTNFTMPAKLAAKMKYDLDRWQRGETNCSTKMPAVSAVAAPSAPTRPGAAPKPSKKPPKTATAPQ